MYEQKIKDELKKEGITHPTLIQKRSYDLIKSGANLLALAKTGTGKTLAYALPSLERIKRGERNSLLIFAPTTELAVQIRRVIAPFARCLGLHVLGLVGAGNRKRQEEKLKKRKPEVLVVTPGRFFDFYSSGRIAAEQIKILVVDEADDILEFRKKELLSSLVRNLNVQSQVLLFGATASYTVFRAEKLFGRPFVLLDVRPEQRLQVRHLFLQVDNRHKIEFLERLTRIKGFRAIAFFDSEASLRRYAQIFAHTKIKAAVLAGNNKMQQQKSLRSLRKGKIRLLLATDLAARGLDIPDLSYVVNFELPQELSTYLHRSGRTGRMLGAGTVVSLGDDHDLRSLRRLLNGKIKLERAYFGGSRLTLKKPRKKRKTAQGKMECGKKHKRGKKRRKNKGYHPHYLKEKK